MSSEKSDIHKFRDEFVSSEPLFKEVKLLNTALELMIKELSPYSCPANNNDNKCKECKYYPISHPLFYDQREKSNECWIEHFMNKAKKAIC